MRHTSLLGVAGLIALATGCNKASPIDGIWLLQFGDFAYDRTGFDCDHNFKDADCPDDDGGSGSSDWDISLTAETSPEIRFAEIIGGKDGSAILVFDNQAYPGTRDGNTWTFQWDRFENSDEQYEHDEGYEERETLNATVTTIFSLTVEKKVATGVHQEIVSLDIQGTESDKWDPTETGEYYGRLSSYAYLWGDSDNAAEDSDCEDKDCEYSFFLEETGTRTVDGTWTSYADGSEYEGIDGAGQAAGL